jgi:hypothetical protein
LFAETMRRTQFHARGFARSRRPRP